MNSPLTKETKKISVFCETQYGNVPIEFDYIGHFKLNNHLVKKNGELYAVEERATGYYMITKIKWNTTSSLSA